MTPTERDRLDLRQAFELAFADERIANIAMEALPPIDYSQLATKQDVAVSAAELRGEIAELRGQFAELGGRVDMALANNLRVIVAAQVATMLMLGGWVAALG